MRRLRFPQIVLFWAGIVVLVLIALLAPSLFVSQPNELSEAERKEALREAALLYRKQPVQLHLIPRIWERPPSLR